jgi:hypothetical protein
MASEAELSNTAAMVLQASAPSKPPGLKGETWATPHPPTRVEILGCGPERAHAGVTPGIHL